MLPEYFEEARDLLYLANQDLKVADRALTGEDPLIEPALFHAQQAAEKAVKAFLVAHAKDYPRTHNLVFLLELCTEVDHSFVTLELAAETLNTYAVGPRYFRRLASESVEHATEALAPGQEVYRFVFERLPSEVKE